MTHVSIKLKKGQLRINLLVDSAVWSGGAGYLIPKFA